MIAANQENQTYSVYNQNGTRIKMFNGENAYSKARRFASIKGPNFSALLDRGPFRWQTEEDEETETDDYVAPTSKIRILKSIDEKEILREIGLVESADAKFVGHISEESKRGRRETFNKLPSLMDGTLLDISDQISREDREDHIVKIKDLRFGQISQHLAPINAPIEKAAFKQLLERCKAFPRCNTSFNLWPFDIVSKTFNSVINHFENETEIVISTRKNEKAQSGRSVFRAVSTTYQGEVDCGDVAWAVHSALWDRDCKDAKVVASYDPETTKFEADIIFQKPYDTQLYDDSKSSIFRFGIRVKSADASNGSISIDIISHRDACSNAQMIMNESIRQLTRRHTGSAASIGKNIKEAIDICLDSIEPFLKQWRYLEATPIEETMLFGRYFKSQLIDGEWKSAAEVAIKYMVDNKKLDCNLGKKALFEILINGYDYEKGNTLDSLINAITRAAHDSLLDDINRNLLEKQAGVLIEAWA